MRDFLVGLLAASGLCLAIVVLFPPKPGRTILRDCELAGVHVIDNDTVIVCRVMKRGPTPEVETKPEEYM